MLNADWLRTRGRAWSSVAIDVAIALYAAWTVLCHAVMLLGGNTYTLLWLVVGGAACAAIGGVAWLVRARRARRALPPSDARTEPSVSTPALVTAPPHPIEVAIDWRERALLGGLAFGVMAVWWIGNLLAVWLAIVAYALVALVVCLRGEAPAVVVDDTSPRWREVIAWSAALLFGILALCAHRWRNDDCYYVNLAVTTADMPWLPLLSAHSVHMPLAGVVDSNSVFPPYRVHTFEALGGLLAFATHAEAIDVMHIGMASVAAFLIPLAYARLFRLLDPERWVWMLSVVVLFFMFDGSGDRGFANQAFIRGFTGKSVMLSVAVPALAYYGMALGQRPTLLALLQFAAAEITMIGLSSTGLWLAPMIGMVAVAVPLALRKKSARTLLAGLVGCAYVIAMALWVRGQMVHVAPSEAGNAVAIVSSKLTPRFNLLDAALDQNLGPTSVARAYLVVMLLSLPLCRTALARRYLAFFYGVLVVLLMNPFLIEFLRYNLLGKTTFQRAMWFAPLPAALAIVFVSAIPDAQAAFKRRALGVGAMALALGVLLTTLPSRYVLSARNNVQFHWPPQAKVPYSAFKLVLRLRKLLPRGSVVLAPQLVSWYLPTVRNHPYPFLANAKYMRAPLAEEEVRAGLVKIVGSRQELNKKSRRRLTAALTRFHIDAIVLTHGVGGSPGLGALMRHAGFRRAKKVPPGYDVWMRRPDRKPKASAAR